MRAQLYDAGTTLMIDPLDTTPGMDSAYYRGLDMEYKWPRERADVINELLRVTPLTGTLGLLDLFQGGPRW